MKRSAFQVSAVHFCLYPNVVADHSGIGFHVDADLGGKQAVPEVDPCDKLHKRPPLEPSSPRFCKRLGKELSVSGPSVVREARTTLGSTSETVIENRNSAVRV